MSATPIEQLKREALAGISDYELLKYAGHDPAKAAEIVLDAKRGDHHALKWIGACRQLVGSEASK